MDIHTVLKKLYIIQEKSNDNREKKLGHGYSKAYRMNPYNPVSYIMIPIIYGFAILAHGIVTFMEERDKNPFKWR